MKGVAVLFCVLSLVLGQGQIYSWDGTGETLAPDLINPCLTDQNSCGCCVMQRQKWQLEQYLNSSLNSLEDLLTSAQTTLRNIRENRVAFSVGLTDKRRCVGPVKMTAINVVYQSIFINIEEAYNSTTGVFTVPRSGVYNLALTVFSDAGSPGAPLAVCTSIRRNGVALAALKEIYDQDQEDQATAVILVELRVGDRVSVSLQPGCWLCDDQNHYNTFSGFLLYATV
ncbi:complement C1q and tumor necrosis factor-related protein 9 [Myxocyprinus asiaticus]|uniref:complement C1q and tumor necrosis factor-related protein 9 n=1 Tax=Myxocyprinus asiaticus TaxID=70543 RepID=UPI0022221E00|nr:complement C1q and tumor necrosis factor-related protein 9 [Myxocyprinus asiaticus]